MLLHAQRSMVVLTGTKPGDERVVSGGFNGSINVTSLSEHYRLTKEDDFV